MRGGRDDAVAGPVADGHPRRRRRARRARAVDDAAAGRDPSGAGKTTLAAELAARLDAPVVHGDDLLDGWGDLEGWWGRLQTQVLAPLAAGRPGRYQRYDWVERRFAEWHDVPVTAHLVVEGCGAGRRAADAVAGLRVWVEAPDDVRLARGLERDGEAMREEWLTWMRAEDVHFAAERTRERADVLVDGCARIDP